MDIEKIRKYIKNTFSRLTLFDWISIALVAGVIVVLGIYFMRSWEWVEAEVKVSPPDIFRTDKDAPFWLANNLKKGDSETDSFGRKVAEIIDMRAIDVPNQSLTNPISQNNKNVYIKVKLRAVKDRQKGTYQFKSKQLAVGSPIELRFPRVFLTGVVTFISGVPDNRIWEDKIVETRLVNLTNVFPETLGIQPWVADVIKIGDKMKDSQDRVVAEVLDKRISPAEKIVTTTDGRIFVGQDPIKKDVFLTLKLKTYKQEGVNYFLDNFKVKVDEDIILALPQIDLLPKITKILQ